MVYASFADYTADAEWLVTRPPDAAFDYVEGFAFVNSDDPVNGWPSVPIPGGARFDPSLLPAGAGPVLYCLEVALYQYAQHRPDDDEDQVGSSNCHPPWRGAFPYLPLGPCGMACTFPRGMSTAQLTFFSATHARFSPSC